MIQAASRHRRQRRERSIQAGRNPALSSSSSSSNHCAPMRVMRVSRRRRQRGVLLGTVPCSLAVNQVSPWHSAVLHVRRSFYMQ